MEKLLDRVPHKTMTNIVRWLQFVSGVGLFIYVYLTFYNFHLAYPWINLGLERISQIVMVVLGTVQVICGIFHCHRCTTISSWPAAVAFTYIAFCAKFDDYTRSDIWAAAVIFAAINWFVSSVSSRRLEREYRSGCTTARGNRGS